MMFSVLPSYAESHACVLKRTTARKHGSLARGAPLGSRYSVIEMVVCPFRQLIELLL
jgi:hypothetical protein